MQNLNTNPLPNEFVKVITSGDWLGDEHMYHFAKLVNNSSNYTLQESWKRYLPEFILPVLPTVKDIQILHSGGNEDGTGHWVCAYYDTRSIYIYDSLNSKVFREEHKTYLKRLFPFYAFDRNPVQSPTVQRQPNSSECGVFAIAFAISLMNGQKPEEFIYDVSLMRKHLLQIFESGKIQNFPCINKMHVIEHEKFSVFRNHESLLDSSQQKRSQLNEVRTWAAVVQQPKRIVSPQVRVIENVKMVAKQPVHSKIAKTAIMASINRETMNTANHTEKFTLNSKAKVAKSNIQSDDMEVLSKVRAEVARTDTVYTLKLCEQDSPQINLVSETFRQKQVGNLTKNVATASSDTKLRRQKRRNARPILNEKSKHEITSGKWLTDLHMSQFAYLVRTHTEYSPRETWRIQMPRTIEQVPSNVKHIQILHSEEKHCVCAYFDTKSIFIYDSFNSKRLHKMHETYLRKLFPFYQFDSKPIKFPTVQEQPNNSDCGVFAIAFATSLVNGYRPDKITYDVPLMRAHLLKMFEDNSVEEFPHACNTLHTGTNKKTLSRKRKAFYERIGHPNSQQTEKKKPRCALVKQRPIDIAQTLDEEIQHPTSETNGAKQSGQLSCGELIQADVTLKRNQESNEERQRMINGGQEFIHQHITSHINNCAVLDQEIMAVSIADTNVIMKNINDPKTETCTSRNVCDKNSDRCSMEMKRIKNRNYYLSNAETLRARAHDLYHSHAEMQRTVMRKTYHLTIENQRARMRKRYHANAETQRTKIRKFYHLNVDKQRAIKRINYLANRDDICEQRRKRYSRKKQENVAATLKMSTANKIIAKYQRIHNTKTIALLQSREKYIAKILPKIKERNKVARKMKAESIIKWCLRDRESKISLMRKHLESIRNKAEVCQTQAAKFSNNKVEDELNALCGSSKHIASAEPYFLESAYESVPFYEPIVINSIGQAANILPLLEKLNKSGKSNSKSWACNQMCKTKDVTLLKRYVKFLEIISICTLKSIHRFISKLKCTANQSNDKLGHSQICYIGDLSCESIFLPVQILSPHFPLVRYIQRLVFKLINGYTKISVIDKALNDGDLVKLEEISKTAQHIGNKIDNNIVNDIELNEEKIIDKYKWAFNALTKRSMDIPRLVCVSCEKLCFQREVTAIDKFRKPITTKIWINLMQHVESEGNECEFVCNYCLPKLRQNTIPSRCILNELITKPMPQVVSSLNEYERILIQRAKAFQIVQRMGTVANKNLPHREMVQKLKGRTFHLPLPTEETLKKICPPTDPINLDHELYILVRGIPTKSKLVWEQLVNVNKVWDALIWLKANNPQYSEIQLPVTADALLADMKDIEFQIEDEQSEDDNLMERKFDPIDSAIEIGNNDNDKSECPDNILDANIKHALLTQVSQSDEIYEQFTIHPLYEKRPDETITNLYQMLKIQDVPLDNRHKSLDLQCFPHLYPYGCNGQYQDRSTRLTHAEFIKSRLMSMHSQYRLDIQYLFYLLNDANIRQLSSGIYYTLKVLLKTLIAWKTRGAKTPTSLDRSG